MLLSGKLLLFWTLSLILSVGELSKKLVGAVVAAVVQVGWVESVERRVMHEVCAEGR